MGEASAFIRDDGLARQDTWQIAILNFGSRVRTVTLEFLGRLIDAARTLA